MNVIERIFFFIESQNIKKTTFEKKVGLPNGYISKIKGSPGAAKLEDILKAFPLLDRDWLLTGKGDMIKSISNEIDDLTLSQQRAIESLSATIKNLSETIKNLTSK